MKVTKFDHQMNIIMSSSKKEMIKIQDEIYEEVKRLRKARFPDLVKRRCKDSYHSKRGGIYAYYALAIDKVLGGYNNV